MDKISKRPSSKFCQQAALLSVMVAALFLHVAAAPIYEDDANPSFNRCWSLPIGVNSAPGISADDTQAYFVDKEGKLIAIELASGRIAWTADIAGNVLADLVVTNGRAFTIASPKSVDVDSPAKPTLHAFSSKTGLPLWSVQLPAAKEYFLSVGGEHLSVVSADGDIWHLSADAGTIRWSASANGTISSPQKIESGRLILAVDQKRIEEFDLKNGSKVASAEVDGVPSFVGAGNSSAAVYSDDRGNVTSIQMGGGKNWKFRAGGKIVYIRAVDDNVLLGSADNFVYFMSVDYGNLLWKRRLPGRVAHGGLVGKDLAVFTVVGERSAYLIELEKGRIVDRVDLAGDDAFLMTPVRANGKFLVAATASGLSGFSSRCGNEKGDKQLPPKNF